MTQLTRFQAALAKTDAEAAILSSSLSQRYLSDFDYTDGYVLVTPKKGYLLADFRYIEVARKQVTEFEVVLPKGGMLDALSDLLRELDLHTVAIEEEELSCAAMERIKAKLPEGVNLVSGASRLLTEQRAVKLPYELERMAAAQDITDRAFAHILPILADRTPTLTERDVALELEFFMRKNGAESVAFDTIAVSGSASSLPHGVPRDLPLCDGFLTMDFGAKYQGYCSDMTRTVVLGKATEEMKLVYETVLTAQKTALAGICGGIGCRAADTMARDVIVKAGYGEAFGHSLGHSVGMFIHESPRLAQSVAPEICLQAGNVVTVEPGIYLAGRFGCRIEDMVAIAEDGSLLNFTKSPKDMMEL
ncbi:MAG: aminopeptidase P family protein [Clostridia bacterium]|nr:aminopeptidase P family protein [Clostridia bacterium]